MKTIVIRGAYPTDKGFTLTTDWGEEITWNITQLRAAANAGKFGAVRHAPTSGLPPADWSEWGQEDRDTVDHLKAHWGLLEEPAIGIASPDPKFAVLVFADGQHRVTARQELGLAEIPFFLVPWDKQGDFRVTIEEIEL